MRKTITVALAVIAAGGVLALGFAVAAFGSSTSAASPATTSETTTAPASTSEQPVVTKFSSKLGRSAEVPKPTGVSSAAKGTFTLTLKHAGGKYTATWKLTFSGLTGKAVAAHIHRGAPGKAGPVLVSLCGPCKSGQSGKAKVSGAAANALNGKKAYVNVHTATNAAGEIRGQVAKTK
ncbi:MAG: CHRD domain-containing protein [Gaiellaceae bacterium]